MAAYKNKVRVAAHRGNSCVCPENTLVAMRSALELPVDMLEIDLHMTKDGHIILMHDHAVDRTTDHTGLIRDYTLAQTRAAGRARRFGASGCRCLRNSSSC